MKTDMKILLQQEYGYTFAKESTQKIIIPSMIYGPELEKFGIKRKSLYMSYFQKMKKDVGNILGDSEKEFSSTKKVSEFSRESIAMAILAMRNQLHKQAQIENMQAIYKMGYDIPTKILNESLDEERNNNSRLRQIKEEYELDIDSFIEDLAERVDSEIDEFEYKIKKDINMEWTALMTAVYGGVIAYEYRLRLIAQEPFKNAYRLGILDGMNRGIEKKNLILQKYIWEATGPNPCDNCIALDGTEVSWDKAQSFLHPNCHCSISIIVG